MTWVVDRGGRIAYKADWTSAANVEGFVRRYLARKESRPAGGVLSPYSTEQLELRTVDRDAFYLYLEERNGPRALEEFRTAERHWAGR
jgi:hypothetical protein